MRFPFKAMCTCTKSPMLRGISILLQKRLKVRQEHNLCLRHVMARGSLISEPTMLVSSKFTF